jgi:hypothetical protein
MNADTDPGPATQFNAVHVKGGAGSDSSAILDLAKVNDVSLQPFNSNCSFTIATKNPHRGKILDATLYSQT